MQTKIPVDLFDCPSCKKPVSGMMVVDFSVDADIETGEVSGNGKIAGLYVSHSCGAAKTQAWGGMVVRNGDT